MEKCIVKIGDSENIYVFNKLPELNRIVYFDDNSYTISGIFYRKNNNQMPNYPDFDTVIILNPNKTIQNEIVESEDLITEPNKAIEVKTTPKQLVTKKKK